MKRITSSICILIIIHVAFTQQTFVGEVGDEVILEADNFCGEIQWQQSENGISWQNIANARQSTSSVTISSLPMMYRAEISFEENELHHSEIITFLNSEPLFWSDPDTWAPDAKPIAGEDVTIPSEKHIILDEDTPDLGNLTIEGTLEFDRRNLELTADRVDVTGRLQIGDPSSPFEQQAIITLTGTDTETEVMGGDRGLIVRSGGQLELHGATPEVVWTQINEHAETGSNQLTLKEAVDWQANDELVIAPTDFFDREGNSQTQQLTIAEVSNPNQLTTVETLTAFRWGRLQYVTEDGISLTPGNLPDGYPTDMPTILDERAEIGNVSRNIIIQGLDDDFWAISNFGAHVMIMQGGWARIEGIRFLRVGQAGKLRKYPVHWHMLSVSVPNRIAGNTDGQYIKKSAITHSRNRGIVIHGTDSLEVTDNIVYDIKGMGIFTEDAAEQGNQIHRNLVLRVTNPELEDVLKDFERQGSSGFWISNPRNYLTGNVSADCRGNGFWMAFTFQTWGESLGLVSQEFGGRPLVPRLLPFGAFENNRAHSNDRRGMLFDLGEIDNTGRVGNTRYKQTSTMEDLGSGNFDNVTSHTLLGSHVFKNGFQGIWHRGDSVVERHAVNADNAGRFFAGAGFRGTIREVLAIGRSLNVNRTEAPDATQVDVLDNFGGNRFPTGFATYHHTYTAKNSVFVNFELVPGEQSGMASTTDYYLRPVEIGTVQNEGLVLINSHPGFKSRSSREYITLAGALWDPFGLWGPEGNYIVYDDPFLTYNTTPVPIEGNSDAGGVSVNAHYIGIADFVLYGLPFAGGGKTQNISAGDPWSLEVNRRLVADHSIVGTLDVRAAQEGETFLPFSRHAALMMDDESYYEISFPEEEGNVELGLPNNLQIAIDNMLNEDQHILLGVHFDGNVTNINVITARRAGIEEDGNTFYQALNSFEEVLNSAGNTYYQDTDQNMVYVKIIGGFNFESGTPLLTNTGGINGRGILSIAPTD